MDDKKIKESVYSRYRKEIDSIVSKAKKCKTVENCLDNFGQAFEVKKNMILDYCSEVYYASLSDEEKFQHNAKRKFFADEEINEKEFNWMLSMLDEDAMIKYVERVKLKKLKEDINILYGGK